MAPEHAVMLLFLWIALYLHQTHTTQRRLRKSYAYEKEMTNVSVDLGYNTIYIMKYNSIIILSG